MNREDALVAAALKFVAKVESGRAFSRETYADLKSALALKSPARTCSSCAHYDANSSATEGVGYCTNPVGWHRAKAMPPHEMCSKWALREDCE